MIIKLELSTGKIIELTKEEYEEILDKRIESICIPFHRILPDPQLQWEYPPIYPYITCGTPGNIQSRTTTICSCKEGEIQA